MTSKLVARVYQHREDFVDGFTKRHNVKRLVYFEEHASALAAIAREKSIKRWSRAAKFAAIEDLNPHWRDLYDDIAR